jgi:hypothetical protein
MSDANDLAQSIGTAGLATIIHAGMSQGPGKRRKPFSQHRRYGRIHSDLWAGQRVRSFQTITPHAKLVYLYLLSSPHANMVGLYWLPQTYIVEATGLDSDQVAKAIVELQEASMIHYELTTKWVYVCDFVASQVLDGDELSPSDNRTTGVRKIFDSLPESNLRDRFLADHGAALHLTN